MSNQSPLPPKKKLVCVCLHENSSLQPRILIELIILIFIFCVMVGRFSGIF